MGITHLCRLSMVNVGLHLSPIEMLASSSKDYLMKDAGHVSIFASQLPESLTHTRMEVDAAKRKGQVCFLAILRMVLYKNMRKYLCFQSICQPGVDLHAASLADLRAISISITPDDKICKSRRYLPGTQQSRC